MSLDLKLYAGLILPAAQLQRAPRAGHARLGARRIRQALGEERGSRVGRRLLLGAYGEHEEQPADRHRNEQSASMKNS